MDGHDSLGASVAGTGKLPRLTHEERARAVLEEFGFDGLIALKPVNVYYLTNCWPVLTRMRYDFGAMATFPRNPKEPEFLVCSAVLGWDLANSDRETPEVVMFGNPSSRGQPSKPFASRPSGHAVDSSAILSAREQGWVDLQSANSAEMAEGPAQALARALNRSGMSRGRLAVDDMRIAYLLQRIGCTEVVCVPGEDVFRRIRMVKTAPELALLRVAGRNNVQAALSTIRLIEKGMRYQDVENLFRLECARRGNDMVSLLAGMSIGGFPDGEVVQGKPFLIDAVSSYGQYLGDFGRTIVLGEPSPTLLARARANRIGRDAVFDMIRPGVRFSDISRVAREAQIKAGMPPGVIIVTPHSVGLEHGDNPGRPDVPFNEPVDIVLEADMVMTIDLPYLEIGWGAGHNEDLIRITSSGFEPMHDLGDPLVVI